MKKTENNIIAVQPNVLLNCADEMSDIEKMLIHFVLTNMDETIASRPKAPQNPLFTIPFPNLSSEHYKLLEAATLKLQKRSLTIIEDDKKKHYHSFCIFPSVEFKNNILTLTMFENAVPYFLALKKAFSNDELKTKLTLSEVPYKLIPAKNDK